MTKSKGQLSIATQQVMGVLVLVVVIGAVALALGGFRDGTTVGSTAYNATDNGLTLVSNVTTQFGVVGTLIGIGILLGAVFVYFKYFRN